MRFLTKHLYQRFPKVGFLADMVLLGTAVTKVVQRRSSGPNSLGVSQSLSVTEMMLAGGAAMRLASRLFRRSK